MAMPAQETVPIEPKLFVPEVVQTSAMDCGPAALKSLLEGYRIPVSFGRLREACQTDIDGTSINALEDVAQQLGLQVEQMMAPVDHLLVSSARLMPALVVTVLPNGFNHFTVAWRTHGPIVQLMDPATGRRWSSHRRFLSEIYRYSAPFSATLWRKWAGGAGFVEPLQQRLETLCMSTTETARLIDSATADASWRGLAALDASVRMVNSLVRAKGLTRGAESTHVIEEFFRRAQQIEADGHAIVPDTFWTVRPLSVPSASQPSPSQPSPSQSASTEMLLFRGAVLLKVSGVRASAPQRPAPVDATDRAAPMETAENVNAETPSGEDAARTALWAASIAQPSRGPETELLHALRQDGLMTPMLLVAAALLAAMGVTVEAALLGGLLVLAADVSLGGWRLVLLGALVIFACLLLLLEFPVVSTTQRLGRKLEARIRIAFLEKIPRLSDRYFHSRLISDMAQRAYGLHQLHRLPDLAVRFMRLCFQLTFTTAGIIWLYPGAAPIALASLVTAVGGALLIQPLLSERDLRVRTHDGALSRFYLDAMVGLLPIRTHSAERIVRREHEMLLVAWVRDSLALSRMQTVAQSLVSMLGIGFAAWIVIGFIAGRGEVSSVLLLLYWALNLPALSQSMAATARQYPAIRNNMRRVLESLTTPEEAAGLGEDMYEDPVAPLSTPPSTPPSDPIANQSSRPLTLTLEDVTVRAGGHAILQNIDLSVGPGEHLAIVGASGAGKSSLVGLFLGWHRPASGRVLVNGELLNGARLESLRRATVWVDPSVRLWNRTLQANLRYGNGTSEELPIGMALEQADLYDVLDRLPNGLKTPLGEAGGLVAGGEGQRVRFGRALLRPDVELVILDEPFRGLDREQRRRHLAAARSLWKDAILLCITHDVSETEDFARVLVLDAGRIVDEGDPRKMGADPSSRYQQLLAADGNVRRQKWSDTAWRRLWLARGRLQEGDYRATDSNMLRDGGSR